MGLRMERTETQAEPAAFLFVAVELDPMATQQRILNSMRGRSVHGWARRLKRISPLHRCESYEQRESWTCC